MDNKEIPVEDWLAGQLNGQMSDWENAVHKFYPQYSKAWTDPKEHFRSLKEERNDLDAVKYLDWKTLLKGTELRALDLGSGTGWLAAFLSVFPNVKRIDALDLSRFNLTVMMPEIIKLMGGDAGKITPVLGMFDPMPVEKERYDIIAASSAVHHSPNLLHTLRECRRVLKPGGKLVILNETPLPAMRYFVKISRFFLSSIGCLLKKSFPEYSPALSRSGFMYDPYLGDNIYSRSQWEEVIKAAGFSFELVSTPYLPKKDLPGQVAGLSHFICEKRPG